MNIPRFGDKEHSYNMKAPASLEQERMREIRKATFDLIALMKEQSWLYENSPAEEAMNEAWIQLYNEFVSIVEAQEGDTDKRNLFKFYVNTREEKLRLKVGQKFQCFSPAAAAHDGTIWEVVEQSPPRYKCDSLGGKVLGPTDINEVDDNPENVDWILYYE